MTNHHVPVAPENCPDPRVHGTFRYCPYCTWIEPQIPAARLFTLERDVDETGISGTGTVAEGVIFSDDTVALRWVVGEHRSTVIWPSIASVEAIHGHGGKTRIAYA